jgi:oxygen-independent coproporphyrinogen-3 oxidase
MESSDAIAHIESISVEEQQAEFCFLGLRLLEGLDKKAFYQRFGSEITQVYGKAIAKLKKQGLLQEKPEKLRLTTQGLDFANAVFVEFLP